MDGYFDRTERLLGSSACEKLQRAHVAIFGLGGVGSYTAEALARSGVGALTLIDHDKVSPSNINRQLYALHSTVGQYKTEVAKQRIADINPHCRVTVLPYFYTPEKRDMFFINKYTYICDAIDTVSAKLDIVCCAKNAGIPVISCMGTGNKRHPELLRITDIYKTEVCPLARVMRRECKKRNISNLTVVYSSEQPCAAADNRFNPENHKPIPASVVYVPATAGLLMASKIIEDIINEPNII